jgi:hypothetical protein
VKAYGGLHRSVRTAEQTDIVYFWSEHAYVHWNRNLIGLAAARRLDVADTTRLFAMAHTAATDAAIAGLDAEYFDRTWRPRTAIPRAAEDSDPKTAPDANWSPLLTVNHPDASVWAGLHYRNSMHQGAVLGRHVAEHVLAGSFRPAADTRPSKEA